MYLEILLLSGFLTAVFLSGIVYYEATRRGVSPPGRLLGAGCVALASIGGFLVPYRFTTELSHLYFRVIKGSAVAVHPREFLVVSLATGIIIGIGVALLCVATSRIWYSKMRSSTGA